MSPGRGTSSGEAHTSPPYPVGVVHGRFQVPHNDHVRYLLAGKALCRELIVGITNPDPSLTRPSESDPLRSRPEANPLSYYERYVMLRGVLEDAGLSFSDFAIVPFPVSIPELLHHYVPRDAVFFLTIYDAWGREKRRALEIQGLATHVLWERPAEEKGIRGSEVRRRIREGEAWEHLVPAAVARLAHAWRLPARLLRDPSEPGLSPSSIRA